MQINQSNNFEFNDFLNDPSIDVTDVSHLRQDRDVSISETSGSCLIERLEPKKNSTFQPDLRAKAKALQDQLRDACEQAAKNVFTQNGYGKGVDCRFRFHRSYRVSIKPAAGSGNAFNAIIQTILSREGASQTQAFVRSKAQEMCPTASITKNWNQPLPVWAIKKVKERAAGLGAPFDTIKLNKIVTLNNLHAACKTAVEKSQGRSQTFTPVVLVSDTHFIVNGVPFPISKNKSGGKEYSCVRVSVQKLQQALEIP